jgi:hypothetical protein
MSGKRQAITEQWWLGLGLLLFWAAVIMSVSRCCGAEAAVIVGWNQNPESGITYRVWRGLALLGETTETKLEVRLPTDQPSTLTVQAVSPAGITSQHSLPLVVAPAVVHSSPDLRVWIVEKSSVFFQTLEREGIRTTRQFFRINYHIP